MMVRNDFLKLQVANGTLLRTNNWIIGDDKSVVIVDCSAQLSTFDKYIGNRKVVGVVLTHGHWDHFQSLDEVVIRYGCKVFLTREAYEKISVEIRGFATKPIKTNLAKDNFVFIKSGDAIILDKMLFNVFETPGHTDCSICLQVCENQLGGTNFSRPNGLGVAKDFVFTRPCKISKEDLKMQEVGGVNIDGSILFTGDTLFEGTYGRVDLPTGSFEQMKASLTFLLNKFPEEMIVLPGHGSTTTIKEAKFLLNEF